jgi:SpoVK/Ycf46/Vps4 family AAA+-type ATPase
VAERIRAPLFKLELHDTTDLPKANMSNSEDTHQPHELDDQFRWAAKWSAVLLIDECDTYLQTRSDHDARRNRLVQTFLQKLEYYPSLLFLTTNRPGTLDPALQSRIHLTINYPALDPASRLTIWRNFLMRQATPSTSKTNSMISKYAPRITEEEIRVLAGLELDGRRIKNLVKSAGIMARREGRGVEMGDLRRVLRITEGVEI